MKRKMYFFTNSFPYGIGEDWKYNELSVLCKYFDEIEIIPFHFDGNDQPKTINFPNVTVVPPLFTDNSIKVNSSSLTSLVKSGYFFYFFKEFIRHVAFTRKEKQVSFFSDAIKTTRLIQHSTIRRITRNVDRNDVFYFFWGKGSCLFAPVLKPLIEAKILVRFHGFDLYEYRNLNYIPFRNQLLKSLTKAITISGNGFEYLAGKYPEYKNKIILNRLGTRSRGNSIESSDGVFRIFSCSSLIPLKRVLLLARAVRDLKMNVEWTHIGDGPQKEELNTITRSFPENIQFKLTGWVDSVQVASYYVNKRCDLFINVSETEGIPVSIMEAYAASIPAYATNVGGVMEIVNNENGKLLKADISELELSVEIDHFFRLPSDKKQAMRKNAYQTYMESFDAFKNAEALASICLQ